MQETDVLIIGAGPIGLELAALLKKAGIAYLQFEAYQIGHTIHQWPRETQFFSAPERVALAGVPVHSPNQQSLTGEMYLSYLRSLTELLQLDIRTYETVRQIQRTDEGSFIVTATSLTDCRQYRCRRLVLATGNMTEPRQLGIPGEEMSHVDHQLVDPHKYFRKRLLVVGGKNSALEAALRCWRVGAHVTLSYRGSEFEQSIVKPHLAREINLLIEKDMMTFYPNTRPLLIEAGSVHLQNTEREEHIDVIPVDFVLLCLGYEMDMSLFEQVGILLQGDEQIPQYDPDTMETNVPHVYVAGTAAGGMERRRELFIATSHDHVEKIVRALTGHEVGETGSPAERRYDIELKDVQED